LVPQLKEATAPDDCRCKKAELELMCDTNLNHRRRTVIQVEFVRLTDLEALVALEGMPA